MIKDLQSQRTERAIISAFIDISMATPFPKITVKNILDKALVSRYCFYSHFHDKYEIAERLQNSLYDDFISMIENKFPQINTQTSLPQDHYACLNYEIINFSLTHSREILAIKDIHTKTINFSEKIQNYFRTKYLETYGTDVERELESQIYSTILITIMNYGFSAPILSKNINKIITESSIRATAAVIGLSSQNDIHDILNRIEKKF